VPHPPQVRRDTTILTDPTLIVAGADTHADTIHVAAVTVTGAPLGDREFPTTRTGYAAAIRFLTSLGQVERIGVEGTASYGAGFARALTATGIEVAEVTRAVKSTRRLKGKSDPLDAYAAARTALAGDGLAAPKDDATAGLRALHIARRSAVKHRTAVINQTKAMLVSAPDSVREKYRGLTTLKLIEALARCRPDALDDPWAQSVLVAAKMLAQRVQFLETQTETLQAQIDAFVTEANPGLRAAYGVGSDTAAQLLITAGANPHRLHSEAAFAALCGVAPVPASWARPTDIDSRAAETAPPIMRCIASRWCGCRTISRPRTTRSVNCATAIARARWRSCASSREPSPGKSSSSSLAKSLFPTTPTFARPANPETSPSPPQPTTSASGPR
jgi:transposase